MNGPVAGRRRAVPQLDGTSAVRVVGAPAGRSLPVEVRSARPGVRLADWARTNRDTVRGWLHRSGALLFRGFDVGLAEFSGVAGALAGELAEYVERSTPRTELADRVYTATDYPADQTIPLHNENSYQRDFPRALVFGCLRAADRGGATPLADTRRVLDRIPAAVLRPFAEHGVRYVRNFGGGLGLSWPEVFRTTSRAAVDRYCAEHGIEACWRRDGGLRTIQVRPAIATHPDTGERVWFNHAAFFNVYTLPAQLRGPLLDQLAEDELPQHTSYGDGRPIPVEVLATLTDAYAAERVAVPWRTGDVLLVDNLLAAHGRQPFTGPRRVAVSMAGVASWPRVAAAPAGSS